LLGSQRPLVLAIAVFLGFFGFGFEGSIGVVDEFAFWADTANPVLATAAAIITTSPRT
jgi:hypothetical protein